MKRNKQPLSLRGLFEKRLECKSNVEALLATLDRQKATYAAEGKANAFWRRRNQLVAQLAKIEDDVEYYVTMGWNK